ncbi:kinase-like domain-containing protein [Phellopilus nigrolimitatus]|nr:kinase-like domain-containing protein [Phellopilus nigrolimitatus]
MLRKPGPDAAGVQVPAKERINKYVRKNKLGKGAFGQVWRCGWYKHGEYVKDVAMKVIPKDIAEKYRSVIIMEKNALRRLYKAPHKNIIRFYEHFYDREHEWDCFIFELAEGGELISRLSEKGAYSERDAAKAMRDVLEGLKHLNSIGLIHRDIKPDNMLLQNRSSNSRLVISDFGLAKHISKEGAYVRSSGTGTRKYIAPESFKYERVGHKSDVWAAGVTLYMLLTDFDAFARKGDTKEKIIDRIKNGQPDYDCAEFTRISPKV